MLSANREMGVLAVVTYDACTASSVGGCNSNGGFECMEWLKLLLFPWLPPETQLQLQGLAYDNEPCTTSPHRDGLPLLPKPYWIDFAHSFRPPTNSANSRA